jgi:outer membrane cobalamin receptor
VKKITGPFLMISIVLVFVSPAFSEEAAGINGADSYDAFDLGEIYVTAERLPASKEVTVTTEIMQEEIKATNGRTAAEALKYVPGVSVSNLSCFTLPDVSD